MRVCSGTRVAELLCLGPTEAQSTCTQGSGRSTPSSQSCGNNRCFLMQEADRWTISSRPQSSKLSFQQACRGRRSSQQWQGLRPLCAVQYTRASLHLPLFGTLTPLGMSLRGAGLSEPNRTTLFLTGRRLQRWTVGSAHASGALLVSQVRVQCSYRCLRSAQR